LVEEEARYTVIEKSGLEGDLVAERDPRKPSPHSMPL
jgi:hypothetical protein